MASTVPAKSQPLHNFYLPEWQWTKSHTNNHHRGRRGADSSSQQSSSPESAHRQSPPLDSLPLQSPIRDSTRLQSPMRDSIPRRQSPMRESAASRRSPMHDLQFPMRDFSLVRRSPMNDSAVRRSSPMRDSALRRSPIHDPPMRDSALRRSPKSDSAARQSPMRDSTSRRSPMHDSAPPRRSPMHDSAPPRRSPPKHDPASESDSGYHSSAKNGFTYDNRKSSAPESAKNGFSLASSDQKIDNSGKKSTDSDFHISSATKEVRSKFLIRIRPLNKPESDAHDEEKTSTDGGEAEELAAKTWNLRPRRPIRKQSNGNGNGNGNGGTSKVGGAHLPENIAQLPQAAANRSEPIWVRSGPDATNVAEKEKKQKFSVSLSREEIEEDIFAMTGSKPARRPKKRLKIVQKQLDNLFPGLWLPPITADLYKVSEAPAKG